MLRPDIFIILHYNEAQVLPGTGITDQISKRTRVEPQPQPRPQVMAQPVVQQPQPLPYQARVEDALTEMRNDVGNPLVQCNGCRKLMDLTLSHADPSGLVARQVVKDRGVEAVLNAMRAHPDDAGVQESGCGALLNIARYNSAAQVRDLGTTDVVRAAQARHPELRDLSQQLLATLVGEC